MKQAWNLKSPWKPWKFPEFHDTFLHRPSLNHHDTTSLTGACLKHLQLYHLKPADNSLNQPELLKHLPSLNQKKEYLEVFECTETSELL